MTDRLVLRQPEVGDELDGVTQALTEAFAAMRAAVLEERPVVVVLDDGDLLGQGTVVDATIATGMLGLVRAFALEGAREGWRVNAITHRGDESGLEEIVDGLTGATGLSGQLIRIGTDHLGKVWP